MDSGDTTTKTPEQIHYNMSCIRSKDTMIEVKLRKELGLVAFVIARMSKHS